MPQPEAARAFLDEAYQRMLAHFGPTEWWPGDTPFEIAIGAILTQNTAWTNVEKAIDNLKAKRLLSPKALRDADDDTLHAALRPSGYFRQKTIRVRTFSAYLIDHYQASIARMAKRPLPELRAELLGLHGIGPETADDILLYACELPTFVVDTYTRRILSRHGWVPDTISYEPLRHFFESHLPADVPHWKEFHGLLDYTGKHYCRTKPQCDACPLRPMLTVAP